MKPGNRKPRTEEYKTRMRERHRGAKEAGRWWSDSWATVITAESAVGIAAFRAHFMREEDDVRRAALSIAWGRLAEIALRTSCELAEGVDPSLLAEAAGA